jgi:hypothetical protein
MTQPASVSVFTVGIQGPPGLGLSFGGLAIVSASAAILPNALTPVDARAASPTLTFPAATDGMVIGIVDIYAASLTHAILLAATGGGITLADPANPGTYSTTGTIALAGAATLWWVFSVGTIAVPINKWLPLWWS